MSALNHARVRLASTVTQKMTTRGISWMAFEQPNPALYMQQSTQQPKRPVTVSTAKATVTVSATATSTNNPTPTHPHPHPHPDPHAEMSSTTMISSATMLSQTQKHTFTTTAQQWDQEANENKHKDEPKQVPKDKKQEVDQKTAEPYTLRVIIPRPEYEDPVKPSEEIPRMPKIKWPDANGNMI